MGDRGGRRERHGVADLEPEILGEPTEQLEPFCLGAEAVPEELAGEVAERRQFG
jgi:hypothetical protein